MGFSERERVATAQVVIGLSVEAGKVPEGNYGKIGSNGLTAVALQGITLSAIVGITYVMTMAVCITFGVYVPCSFPPFVVRLST